ncbi:GAF and ANTAR domain-containing protein [Kocuria turfanensis]|uniref:Transcriptional regulator n=1 Tax=Kocuria turfanensis TaxID=388357 RepID=A0A512IH67_9MICC|nr:GAF and ANTAR domain-containing protein [Kocuria turfanensis]GEO97052.1 transcriptional regulator [Kocuria turfanensis]
MPPDPSPGELATVFAQLHGMLLSQDDATAAVSRLARAAQQMIPAAAGAGVSLLDTAGTRVSTAATDPVVEAADAAQYELGTGPCLTAWATQEPQRIEDTTTETRWAGWEAAAAASGIRSVLSTPLVHRGRALGALKVYATTPGAFGPDEERLLGLFAEAAATLLGAAQPVETPTRLNEALKTALATRETVGLATGVLMAQEHLAPEAARTALLETARAQGRRVAEVAAELIETATDREDYQEEEH